MRMVEENTIDKSRNIHTWGEFSEIIKGNGVQKVDFVDEGYGCIHYGQIYTHYGPYTYNTNKFVSKEIFDKAKKASKGDIIMTDTSENVEDICKSVAYLGNDDIAVSNHALIIKHNQNPKFLSYSTLTDSFFNQKRKVVVGVKVSGIKPEQLAKIKIYLPSLSEQERIVDILDTFTSSIDNLKQQIAQRRKQYEYYRDQLLDLEGKEGVEMKTISEVAKNFTGLTYKPEFLSETGTLVLRSSNIDEDKLVFVDNVYVQMDIPPRAIVEENDILICVRNGSKRLVGKAAMITKDAEGMAFGAFMTILRCFDINSKFLFFVWQSTKVKMQYKGDEAMPIAQITAKDFQRIIIPVPPISEQQRIVSILDTFEASIQNLEAQLSQREKQYEYYRNKLLTFE